MSKLLEVHAKGDLFVLSVWVHSKGDTANCFMRKTIELPSKDLPQVIRDYAEDPEEALRVHWNYVREEKKPQQKSSPFDGLELDLGDLD